MHVVIYSLLVANVISLSGCRRRDTSGGPLGVIPDSVSRARCSKELENLSTFHSLSPRTKGNRLPPERDGRTFACWAVCFCFLLFEMSILQYRAIGLCVAVVGALRDEEGVHFTRSCSCKKVPVREPRTAPTPT
jgi:hypothetical protein